MRKHIKIPRILKINWIKGLSVSVVYNNGESRIIDFRNVLLKIGVDEKSPASILFNEDEFKKAEIENNTLSWNNVEQYITLRNNEKVKVPFEIGADVLLKYSQPEKSDVVLKIGRLIRESRMRSGLSQQELAIKSGTTRNYISRIENDRSDIEIATLRKIVETGLGKQLDVRIK
ncbi:helix-turn-helix domain-containing protein [Perlabentimonas gracilis]|uniref:helix-turn-helix domain-containing protein n=1 Tax=Perlabentimonas gracilis TaxID=2715279 RepID=UPI001407683B|nr:helix-turn-helix transcriptional regulator [Perlabentimonas gracilis]NHB70376.1 helix-turn-helix domain-containing protein [Perlabentimonas gracilis]